MEEFAKDDASGILLAATPPCLSLYMPTHRRHPDNQQNVIRYRNLIRTLQASLHQQHQASTIDALLEPFRALADDDEFWHGTRDGLAVLGANDFFRVYRDRHVTARMLFITQDDPEGIVGRRRPGVWQPSIC